MRNLGPCFQLDQFDPGRKELEVIPAQAKHGITESVASDIGSGSVDGKRAEEYFSEAGSHGKVNRQEDVVEPGKVSQKDRGKKMAQRVEEEGGEADVQPVKAPKEKVRPLRKLLRKSWCQHHNVGMEVDRPRCRNHRRERELKKVCGYLNVLPIAWSLWTMAVVTEKRVRQAEDTEKSTMEKGGSNEEGQPQLKGRSREAVPKKTEEDLMTMKEVRLMEEPPQATGQRSQGHKFEINTVFKAGMEEETGRSFGETKEDEAEKEEYPFHGIIDTGCTSSCGGVAKMDLLQTKLLELGYGSQIELHFGRKRRFKYADNMKVHSSMCDCVVPTWIGKVCGSLEVSVVESRTPILISVGAMCRAGALMNFRSGEVVFLDVRPDLGFLLNCMGSPMASSCRSIIRSGA